MSKAKLFQRRKNYAELSALILQMQFLTYKFQKFKIMRLILRVIMTLHQQLLTRLKIIQGFLILNKDNLTRLLVLKTHENKVRKIIKNLKVHKTCQGSNIPTKITKLNIDLYSSFICQNCNYCISIGKFPNELKHGDVIPVDKKG